VLIGGTAIYPIFKNGSSSLFRAADTVQVNQDIKNDNIVIFLREPAQRFVKGLNSYCVFNGLDVHETYREVKSGKLCDRHFAPQSLWLMHLFKYHKGLVTLKSMDQVKHHCDVHMKRIKDPLLQVEPLRDYTRQDEVLVKHIGQTMPLANIIEETHALS